MRRSPIFPLLLLLLLGALLPPAASGRSHHRSQRVVEWSATVPPVNQTHIFEGQINQGGKPVGFHARPGGRDPGGARMVHILNGPNRSGVYTAEVEIRSGDRWLVKTSTFYPDAMSREEVLQSILHAFRERAGSGEKFRGPSGRGFTIEGYFQAGRINTAYPIFQR